MDDEKDPLDGETDPETLYVAQYFHERSDHFKDFQSDLGTDWLCNCVDKARQAVAATHQRRQLADIDHVKNLSMPFVVVESKGGPFDDESFTAGFACGFVDAQLSVAHQLDVTEIRKTLRRSELPQLDLIAKRYHFTMTVENSEIGDDQWCEVTFSAK